MLVSLRVLSVISGFFHKLGLGRWLIAIPLIAIGIVKLAVSWKAGAWWLGGAVLVLAAGKLAESAGFLYLVPDDLAEWADELPSGAVVGVAGGWMRTREGYDWLDPERTEGVLVQLRWLANERPPALAVLTPDDMPVRLKEPVQECRSAALWYPGVQVRTGWLTVGWRLYPGLELEYIGRRMRIALNRPGEAKAIARLMRESA